MKKSILLPALLLASLAAFAQKEHTLLGSSGFRLTGLWGGWTSAASRFPDGTGYLQGGFFGAEFGKIVFIGGSSSYLSNGAAWNGNAEPLRFDLYHGGLLIGAGWQNWRVVHPQFHLMVGGGEARLQGQGRDPIFVVQPQAGLELNVARWFHLALDGGYRFVDGADFAGLTDADLSSPFVEAKFKFGWSWGRSAHRKNSERQRSSR